MSDFGGDLRAFSRSTGIRFDKVVRKVVIDMTASIVHMTPVDQGYAKNNYFWGNLRVNDTDLSASDKGSGSTLRALAFAGVIKAGGVCYITNNLPYIMKLEYGGYTGDGPKTTASGYSTQAPAGMARITVARWQEIVNKVVGSIR